MCIRERKAYEMLRSLVGSGMGIRDSLRVVEAERRQGGELRDWGEVDDWRVVEVERLQSGELRDWGEVTDLRADKEELALIYI